MHHEEVIDEIKAETLLFMLLNNKRLDKRKEFFSCSLDVIVETMSMVKKIINENRDDEIPALLEKFGIQDIDLNKLQKKQKISKTPEEIKGQLAEIMSSNGDYVITTEHVASWFAVPEGNITRLLIKNFQEGSDFIVDINKRSKGRGRTKITYSLTKDCFKKLIMFMQSPKMHVILQHLIDGIGEKK